MNDDQKLEYSKRDPVNVPQDVTNHIFNRLFGDDKTIPPDNALANAAWSVCGPQLLEAVKLAYRKHHLEDDTIGWEELSGALQDALCKAMGDSAFVEWMQSATNGDRLR